MNHFMYEIRSCLVAQSVCSCWAPLAKLNVTCGQLHGSYTRYKRWNVWQTVSNAGQASHGSSLPWGSLYLPRVLMWDLLQILCAKDLKKKSHFVF